MKAPGPMDSYDYVSSYPKTLCEQGRTAERVLDSPRHLLDSAIDVSFD